MKQSVFLAIGLSIGLLFSPAPSRCAGQNGIRVLVKKLHTDKGRVGCGLFNGANGFPRDESKALRVAWVPKHKHVAICDFLGVAAGTYAVTILDDSNENGKMDFNFIGLPKKGYGFSNDAKSTLSPPSFKAASFNYDGAELLTVTIHTVYWLH